MKIELAKTEIIHFVGIGGIGMSGLALIMKSMGFKIQGSDIFSNKNTTSLITIIAGLCCILMLRIITLVNKIKNYKKR